MLAEAPPPTAPTVFEYAQANLQPSASAVESVLNGEDGAWGRVALVTLMRAAGIAPGLWLGGIRGRQIVTGSVMAAVTITAALFAMYSIKRTGQ